MSSRVGIRLCPPAVPDNVASSHMGTSLRLRDRSDGFGPSFSSLALGTPRPHLPASVLHSRRQPRARRRRSAPLGWWSPAHAGGASMLGPPQLGLCCFLRLCFLPCRCCSFLLLRWGCVGARCQARAWLPLLPLQGQGRPWVRLVLCHAPPEPRPPRHGGCSLLSLCNLPPRPLPAPALQGGGGDAGGVSGLLLGG